MQRALEAGLDHGRTAGRRDFRRRLEGASGIPAPERSGVKRRDGSPGPVGWGLRLSGWGSGGLAGAALASQASLPAGLLVAATGAVLDEVQARGRRPRPSDVVATADGVLDGLARQALGPARTVAAARGLAAEDAGYPTIRPGWRASPGHAHWPGSEVTGPMLDAAVTRWWQWARLLLLPVVQLPLLALVAHVGYRVARAYWEGPLAPRRLLSERRRCLPLLWTVAGTVVAALTLSGVAAGVVRTGRRRSPGPSTE